MFREINREGDAMSQKTMLALLRANPEGYVSGEQVSEQLGLSRAAVWKAVDALRRKGYDIEARAGMGYRLVSAPDLVTEEEIRAFLRNDRELHCFAEIDSTNTYLKKLAMTGAPHGTAAVADCQTAGRGRMDRVFQSPKGKGIYLSVLLRPELPPQKLLPVTALCGVGVCRAVERVCGIRPQLKWPNDPVVNGKKLCGILTEMALEGETGRLQYLVLGVGLNVAQTAADFTPDVAAMATSVNEAAGRQVSRAALTAAMLEEIDAMYGALCRDDTADYLAEYRTRCVNLGKTVQLIRPNGSRDTVTAEAVDEEFSLVVRYPDGRQETVRTGEVSVRGMYGYVE